MSSDDSSRPAIIDELSPYGTFIVAATEQRFSPAQAALRRALHYCRFLLPTLAVIAGIALILINQSQDIARNIAGIALVIGGIWDHK